MDSIKVCIRARPLITREKEQCQSAKWTVGENCLKPKDNAHQSYVFDRVFDEETITDEVFCDIASPIVEAAMQGFNGTIFAYGQTASGKTHTMMGNDKEPGVIPQAVHDIYSGIENCVDREFLIRVSYLEIYNENVHDLLGDRKKALDVRESQTGDIFVNGLSEEIVNEPKRIWAVMKKGEANRHFGVTNMNERSSRSHTIFKVIIESRDRNNSDGAVKVAHLNLVDLAGSEKAKQTGASGQRLTEGGHINKSLFTLGQVISQLSDNASFVNYRDSKLTRILQNSLGGNSKTAIICNITTASLEETLSTLRFASSAKRIKNKPILNEVLTDEALLKRYKREIDQLKKRVDELNKQSGQQELKERLAEKERLESEQEKRIAQLTKLMWVSKASDDLKQRKRRRETWCLGKASHSAAIGRGRQVAGLDLSGVGKPECYGLQPAKKSRLSTQSLGLSSLEDFEEEEPEDNDQSFVVYHHEELVGEYISDPLISETRHEISCQTDPTDHEDHLLTKLTAELEKKDKIVEDLEAKIVEKDFELDMLGKAVDGSIQNDENELKVQAELNELRSRIKLLTEERDHSLFTQAELLQKIHQSEQTRSGNHDQNVDAAIKLSEELFVEIDHLKNQKQQLGDELSHIQLAYHELEQQLKQKDQELNELEEFTRMEADLKNASLLEKKDQLVEMENKMSISKVKNTHTEELEKQVETLLTEKQLLEEKLKEVGNAIDNSATQESQLASELRSRLECTEKEKTESEIRLAELEVHLSSLSTVSVDSCDLKLIELEGQLKALQREKDEADNRLAEMEESVQQPHMADPNLQVIELENRLDAMTRENKELETRLAEFEEQLPVSEDGTKIADLENKIAVLIQEKEDLELKVADSGDALIADLNDKILTLETERDEAISKSLGAHTEVEERMIQMEEQLERMEKDKNTSEAKLIALNNCIEELEQELESSHETVVKLQTELESKPDSAADLSKQVTGLQAEVKAQKLKYENLLDSYDKLAADQNKTKGKLISEENRDLDLQHRLDQLEKARRNDLETYSRSNQENTQLIGKLESQVYELNCKWQKSRGEAELATHKAQKVDREKEELKKDIVMLEDLRLKHESTTARNQSMDPEKMMDRIKKLNMSLDLTNQRCQKYESKQKEMEAAARKAEDAIFERNSLQVQLREVQHTLKQKHDEVAQLHQRYSGSYTEVAQIKLECDNLKENLRKVNADNERMSNTLEDLSREKESLATNNSGSREEINKLANENSCLLKELKQLKEKLEGLTEELEYHKTLPPPVNVEELEKNHQAQIEREMAKLQAEERAKYEEKIVTIVAEEREKNAEELHSQIMDIRTEAMEKFEEVKNQLAKEQDQTVNAFHVKHKEEICDLEVEHAKVLQSLEVKHEEFVSQLKAGHKSEMDKILSSSGNNTENRISSLTQEVAKLQEELCEAETILTNKEAEIEKLETKQNSEIEELHEDIKTIETDLIEKHNLDIENLKKQHREEIYELTERYHSESSNEVDTLSQKHIEEAEKLRLSIQTLEQTNSEMVDKLDCLSSQLDETEKERNVLRSKLQECEDKLEAINSELQKSTAEENCASKSQQEELLSDLSKHRENIRVLEEELSSEKGTSVSLAEKVSALEAKIVMGKQMLQSKGDEIEDLLEQYALEKQTVELLKEEQEEEMREYKEQIMLLETNIEKNVNQIMELETVIDNLKSRANTSDNLDSMIITLEELLAKKETQVNELRAKLEENEIKHAEELITLEKELEEKLQKAFAESQDSSDLTAKLEAVEKENQALKDAKQMLEEEVEQMNACFKEYNEELSAQQLRLEEADLIKQSHQETNQKCQTLEEELQSLTAEVERLRVEADAGSSALQKELAAKESELQTLSEEFGAAQRNFEESETWLKNCCDAADAELNIKNAEVEAHQAEINRLTEQLAKANVLAKKALSDSSQEDLYAQISSLQSEIIQLKADHVDEKSALSKHYEDADKEINHLTKEVEEKQRLISSMSIEMDKLNEEIRYVESSKTEQCNELMQHCDDADSELEQAQRDISFMKKRATAMEKEIESLKTDLANKTKEVESSGVMGQLRKELKEQNKKLVESDLKVAALERDLIVRMDPLKKEIHSLQRENKYLNEKLQETKKELRKAKNAANESVLVKGNTSRSMLGGKSQLVDPEADAFHKEAQLRCKIEEIESLKKKLAREEQNNQKLKQHQLELEDKLTKYKSHFRKELGEEERTALRDMMTNSPAPPELEETMNLNVWASRSKKTDRDQPANCEQQ